MNSPTVENRRLRVCHLVVLPQLDGSQRVMLELVKGLDRTRFEPHVMCQGEGPLTEVLSESGIPFHLVPQLRRPIAPWSDVRALLQIKKLARQHRFDIFHTHNSKGGMLGRIGAKMASVPVVAHHVQGFAFHEFSRPVAGWFYNQLERQGARHCDALIFVNQEELELTKKQGWSDSSHKTVIPNGIDLKPFASALAAEKRKAFRLKHGIADQEVAIAFSGRLSPQKQPLILPKIAAALGRLRPEGNWCIYVFGAGAQEEELALEIRKAGLGDRVRMLGWQEQPDLFVCGCDVMLLPSLWEGLPLVLLEGLAAGLPVVASDVKGNREVVNDATGFLCGPKDAEDYARALKGLVDSSALRRAVGGEGRERATQLYGAELMVRRVESLYEEMFAAASEPEKNR